MSAEPVRKVRCPGCSGDAAYSPANRYRPFCGPRCAGVDLGAWASEAFTVPVVPAADDDDEASPGSQAGGQAPR